MIYFLIIALIIIFDRITKILVSANMAVGDTIPLIENIFHLTYVQNRGAAFSMWEQQWLILVLLPAVVMAVGMAVLYIKRKTWNRVYLLSIAFICGGGLGNLIDRTIQGYVVDFFDFRVFPVFNIADICVVVRLYDYLHHGNI